MYSKSMTNNIVFTIRHNFYFPYIKYLAISHNIGNTIFSFRALQVLCKDIERATFFLGKKLKPGLCAFGNNTIGTVLQRGDRRQLGL